MNNYRRPETQYSWRRAWQSRDQVSHVTTCHAHHHNKQITDDGKTDRRRRRHQDIIYNQGVKTRGQFCVILSGVKSLFWSGTGLDQSYYVCHGRLVPAPGTRTEAMRGSNENIIMKAPCALCETLLLVVAWLIPGTDTRWVVVGPRRNRINTRF